MSEIRNIKVSVIVPVFNVRPYIMECLDSILNQTLQDIEIICGDGGSTDGTLEILNEYASKDARIRIVSKGGSGYGQSVNDCIKIARGQYIGLVESDDCIKPDMYEVLYTRAKKDDLDWVRGDIYFYYTSKRNKPVLRYEKILASGNWYNEVLNPQTDVRPYQSRIRTWSGIYKRAFLTENSIYHNETPGGSFQDIGFYLKTLYYATKVGFVPQGFYQWRQDNPNASSHYNADKLVDKCLNEWNLEKDYLNIHSEFTPWQRGFFNHRRFLSYMWAIDMASGEAKERVRKAAREEILSASKNREILKDFFSNKEWREFQIFVQYGKTANEYYYVWTKTKRLIKHSLWKAFIG